MHDYTEYFAHRLKRMATEVDYIALIVVSGFYANKLPGTDIVLYRWRSATSKHDQGRHELVRFSPFDEERARRFFSIRPGWISWPLLDKDHRLARGNCRAD
ncbi:MAG: hypothetical protein AAB507_00290 [Patescibacteria group bacterium]